MVGTGDFHALALVEALAQGFSRQPQLVRRQQRPLDVVAALLVALRDLGVEALGRVQRPGRDHRHRVVGQVVEQGRGDRLRRRRAKALARRLEEQRQVVLHPGRRAAGLEVLEQRAAPLVQVEALHQRVHGAPARSLVQRHFAAGQHVDRVDLVQRALGFGVEAADRFDVGVQQLDPVGRVGAHRVHVQQAAAHREVTRVEHLRHVPVAGRFQAQLLRVQVQRLARLQVEGLADHVAHRRQPLHQRGHRHHHDPVLERGQPVQRRQPLADDVRVRAELVVGQGFPVRERQHRQVGRIAQQGEQVAFQLVRVLVVRGHQQQRPAVGAGGADQHPGERRRRGRRAPEGALLAAAGQRGSGRSGGCHRTPYCNGRSRLRPVAGHPGPAPRGPTRPAGRPRA